MKNIKLKNLGITLISEMKNNKEAIIGISIGVAEIEKGALV